MTTSYKFNPFTKKLDLVGTGGGPGSGILTINTIGPNGGGNFTFESLDGSLTFTPVANGLNVEDALGLSRFPITPYVVGPVGKAGYQTIQSGINAANAAGGGVVYIQPGSYTENLTLFSNVDLYGIPAVSQNQGSSVSITGTHTPPTSGHCGFNSICFISTTNAFFSITAGSTHLVFLNCESAIQNGYFLNLLNWTGTLEIYDFNPNTAGAPFAVNDGGINNTGGSLLLVFSAGLGSGTNVMNLSGTIICQGTSFECPVNFETGSQINITDHVFNGVVTFANNSTGSLTGCLFNGGTSASVTMSSSGSIRLIDCQVNSSNNPAIAGSGAGTLTLNNVTFINNDNIANTLTLSNTGGLYPPGNLGVTGDVWTSNGIGICPTFQDISASGAITTFDIDNGGPISPVAGVVTLNGVGGNETNSTGAGEIQINNRRWLTAYVVDPSTTAGTDGTFTTIQAAINAAFADGGGDVQIRGNTAPYIEDLTFLSGVNLTSLTSDGRLDQFGGFGVAIQGNHTFAGNGTVGVKGILFFATGGTVLTITNPVGIGLFGFVSCEISNTNGPGISITNGGTAAIVSLLGGSITTLGVVCDVGANTVFAGQNSQIQSTGGNCFDVTGIVSLNYSSAQAANIVFNIIDSAGNINIGNAQAGGQTGVNFAAAGSASAINVSWDCNSGTGFYIDGAAGNYNYQNDNIQNSANRIAPGITEQKAAWRPRAQAIGAASNGSDYGTCAFDSASFTVTDGFVQLAGGGSPITAFDIDSGGPINPVAGVITLNGIGGNVTGTTGAGEIFVDNEFWLSSFVVDPNATPGSRGSFQTIQSAINAAFGGPGIANIYIRPGTYTEDLIFHIGINLIGVGPSEKDLSVGFNNDVIVVGVHSLTGEDGSIRIQNITFQANNATPQFIIDSAVASSGLSISQCSITNSGGACFEVGSTAGVTANLNMDSCSVFSSTDAINFPTASIFEITNSKIISQAGAGVIYFQTIGSGGRIDNCFFGTSTFGVGLQGTSGLLELTNSTINSDVGVIFAANSPVMYSLHNTWNCNDAGGEYVIGAVGTYNYADDILIGSARGIANTVTSVPQEWKPFTTSGNTSTAVRGTAAFDSNDFTVVNGFVSLNGSGNGTATTNGAVTADLITIPLGVTAGTYQFEARVAAFEAGTPSSAGYNIYATIRTDGATATLVGNQDIFNEDVALAAADAYFTVSGNNAILQVLGVAALTIDWSGESKLTFVN